MTSKYVVRAALGEGVPLAEYEHRGRFRAVADVVLETRPRVQTCVRFVPCVEDWKARAEWVYLLVFGGRVVKIGGTSNGLHERAQSYLCGHHVVERGKSGKCSVTNAVVYHTLEAALRAGQGVRVYGWRLPEVTHTTDVLGREVRIRCQTFHAYEGALIDAYRAAHGAPPPLCVNSSPETRA